MAPKGGIALGSLVALLCAGCGDRVLGGTTPEGGVFAPGACAAYMKGSLFQPGVSAVDYCAVAERVCGFGETPMGPVYYLSLADCQTKYAGENETQRACSAGRVCEGEATGSSAQCEAAAFGCGNL
jgi:hypothetical protein